MLPLNAGVGGFYCAELCMCQYTCFPKQRSLVAHAKLTECRTGSGANTCLEESFLLSVLLWCLRFCGVLAVRVGVCLSISANSAALFVPCYFPVPMCVPFL